MPYKKLEWVIQLWIDTAVLLEQLVLEQLDDQGKGRIKEDENNKSCGT